MLDTLATSGEYPTASSTGNVTSVPEPTTTLMAPAAPPASSTTMASRTRHGA